MANGEDTKKICFSHFTVEVPATATVVFGPAEAEVPITYFPGEGGDVIKRVTEQLAEVEKDRMYLNEEDEVRLPLFGKVSAGGSPGQQIVFGSKNRATYSVHSFIPVGPDLFVQRSGGIFSKDEAFAIFNPVASSLRLRAAEEVPTERGSCIDGGFIPENFKLVVA